VQAAFDAYGGGDGGIFDGPSYGSLGYAYSIALLDTLDRNTGSHLLNRMFVRQTPYYFMHMTYNDRMLPFEDAGWASYSNRPWGEANPLYAIYRVAAATRDTRAQGFADCITDPSLMLGYVWKDPSLAAAVKVTDGNRLDLIVFCADSRPVDQRLELVGAYERVDGGAQVVDSTGVNLKFETYAVLRLMAKN